MKKLSKILLISFLAVFLAAGSALAVPVYESGTSDLVDLFDDLGLTAGGYDVIDDQQTIPYWGHSPVGMISKFVFTDLVLAGADQFGIFSANTGQLVPLFNATHTGSTTVDFLADGSLSVYGNDGYTVAAATTGFGDIFGFYVTSDTGFLDGTYYSDTLLNPTWTPAWDPNDTNTYSDWMLFYQGDGTTTLNPFGNYTGGTFLTDDWLIACDGWPHNPPEDGMLDFTDIVVLVESVTPSEVPEPATMLLLGSGLIGLAGIGRKKFFK